MKRLITALLLSVCFNTIHADNTWHQRFVSPQEEAKPWTFWHWMYGCVTDEGIRLDLNAMHAAGIRGFYLMPIKDTSAGKEYGGTARQLSAEWWKRMDTVFRTADSLGMEMGIHFSDGFALAGGPWIKPEESMQRVVWSDTIVSGGKRTIHLAQPASKEGYYNDIAVYAYPADHADNRLPASSVTFPFGSSEPCDIIMSYDKPFTLRRAEVITGGNNYQAHRFKVYASDNGTDYRFVREISPARQGWQNTDAYATYAIPATTARYFKFCWTPIGSDPGSEDMDAAKWKPNLKIGNLKLSSEPVIDGYEGKSGVVWRVSKAFATADADCVSKDKLLNLTASTEPSANGTLELTANLPKGNWHILRMGHTSTSHTNATGGGARGLECDKFSHHAVKKQFDNWFANIYRHAPEDVAKRVLKRLFVESWECGSQNWSGNFAAEFKSRRGYDLMPWLPVYAGVPVSSSAESDKVLRDIRQTISDLVNDVFFKEVREGADRFGCKLSTECVAPTMVSDGLRHYAAADYPMGEYWFDSPTHDKPNDILDAVSGAHIYGKNIVGAESFTQIRGTWDEHPARLKRLLDHNLCIGINSTVFHTYVHNPWTDRAPGMTLDGIGTFFQRDNTWWNEMPAFTDYISRCQALLQYGHPVIDLAVYTGDETPRRAILPERLITSLPGLFTETTKEAECKRKENAGQPLETSPVGVRHTANMTKASDWVNPLNGYKYDSFNHDVLNLSHVENNRLVTPGGTSYGALVIPQPRLMNPDNIVSCEDAINKFESEGLPVIKQPWTNTDLSVVKISRDAVLPEGIDYTHRHAADADIYFLSNQTGKAITFTPDFRAKRAFCYMADAVSGKVYKATRSVTLPVDGSIFYVFTDSENIDTETLSEGNIESVAELTENKWSITFDKTGRKIENATLFDWSQSAVNDIKYYSGHATYETVLNMKKKPSGSYFIDFGSSAGDLATVYINGVQCGTAWCAPYRLDVSDALKKGKNNIKIIVVNTWANALLGNDLGTPPFKGIWTNGKFRRAEKTLLPAGLTAVRIIKQL